MTNRGKYRSEKSRSDAFKKFAKEHDYDCASCMMNPGDKTFNENVCECFRKWLDRDLENIEAESKRQQKKYDGIANLGVKAIADLVNRISQLEKAFRPILEFDVNAKIDAYEYGNLAESAIRQAQEAWKGIPE